MISKKQLRRHGLTPQALKKFFTAKVKEPNIKKLIQLMADRIKDGRLRNLSEYKEWAAVDLAWDAPLAQISPTLMRGVLEKCMDAKSVMEAMKGWGLAEETLMRPREIDGQKVWEMDVPLFFNVLVPLVKAYVTIRWAKIFNDRNLTPLFEYPPREFTSENRLLCKVLTQVVESVSIDMGYSNTLRDFILNALLYSKCIKFPMEPWWEKTAEDDDGEVVVEKQGVRNAIPHITRMYHDLTYDLASLNTNTGIEFAGYWTIKKWGEIAMDTNLWNRNAVPHGTNWLDPSQTWYNYFKEVFPCTMEFPNRPTTRRTDRESMAFRYTRTDFDSALFLTYHYQQLVPSDWGISEYDHPVWMRFTIGGDDTVMYAEVFTYDPLDVTRYDSDSNRGKNASLALEILPFQDIVGNVLTQFLQTIKRNLANIVFYDTDVIDKDKLESLRNRTNAQYNGLNFVGYSGLRMDREGSDINSLFKQINFQFQDTNQILSGINTSIAMLERVLGMSAQEVGSAASHQQSKKEVEIISGSATNRLAFTAGFIDDGIEAWKRHLAEAIITNMDGQEVLATIPTDIPNLEEALEAIGFEFVENPVLGQKTTVIRGKITKKHLVQFVARRSDADRETDTQVAQLMMTALQTLANTQFIAQLIDPTSWVELFEVAARLGGADDDFKVRLNSDAVLAGQLQKLVQNIQNQVMGAVEKEVVQPTATEISGIQQSIVKNNQESAQAIAKVQSELQQVAAALAKVISGGQMPQPPQPPPSAPAVLNGAPAPPAPMPAPVGNPQAQTTVPNMLVPANPRHVQVARQFLAKAKGKKNRARELAAQAGYKF